VTAAKFRAWPGVTSEIPRILVHQGFHSLARGQEQGLDGGAYSGRHPVKVPCYDRSTAVPLGVDASTAHPGCGRNLCIAELSETGQCVKCAADLAVWKLVNFCY